MQKQLLARLFAAPVKTIPNNLSKHGRQGAVSNLVSGGDARLPGVLALQRRWCWREADAGSGLEERTAGTSELLEDRDSGCSCWVALGAGPSIRTLQSLQMSEPGDQITAHSLDSSTHRAQKQEGTVRCPCTPRPPGPLSSTGNTHSGRGAKSQSAPELVRRSLHLDPTRPSLSPGRASLSQGHLHPSSPFFVGLGQ